MSTSFSPEFPHFFSPAFRGEPSGLQKLHSAEARAFLRHPLSISVQGQSIYASFTGFTFTPGPIVGAMVTLFKN